MSTLVNWYIEFPTAIHILTAFVLTIAFIFFLSESIISWIIGLLLWKTGISKSWNLIECRLIKGEFLLHKFELGSNVINSIFTYWKRILPLELLYLEASSFKFKFNILKLEMNVICTDLTICFRITHQNEWNKDLEWAKEIALGYKHRLVDHFTTILFENPSLVSSANYFHFKLDRIADFIQLNFENMNVRFVDSDINYSFGLRAEHINIKPSKSLDPIESFGASKKVITAINTKQYCNPSFSLRDDGIEDDVILFMDHFEIVSYVPDLFTCLLQPGFSPYGKEKRLKFTGKANKTILTIHEKQAEIFWYHFLKAFGFYEFRPWKYKLYDELKLYERNVTPEEEIEYVALYKKFREEKRQNELNNILNKLLKLEYPLNISSIMKMRRKAIEFHFTEEMVQSQLAQDSLLPYDLNSDNQDVLMSRYLASKRDEYEFNWCRPWYIHEIYFSGIKVDHLVIKVLDDSSESTTPKEFARHGGCLITVFDVKDWVGDLKYLLHKNKEGYAQGANLVTCEPNFPVLHIQFKHLSCRVTDVNVNSKSVYKCLLENSKRNNKRQHFGFEFSFKIDSNSIIDANINFGKCIFALGLIDTLHDTNMIVHRGFWSNAKRCEIFIPQGIVSGMKSSKSLQLFEIENTILEQVKFKKLLTFNGQKFSLKIKCDSVNVLFIENLNNIDSKIQKLSLGVKFSFVSSSQHESYIISLREAYLRQWYPNQPSDYSTILPHSFSTFLGANNVSSFQSDILLDIGLLQFSSNSYIISDNNNFLNTISYDYWKGDFSRIKLAAWINFSSNFMEYKSKIVSENKSIDALKIVLSWENGNKEFDIKYKETNIYFETDFRISVNETNNFYITLYALIIDSQNNKEVTKFASNSFLLSKTETFNAELFDNFNNCFGTIRIQSKCSMPLVNFSVLNIQNIVLDQSGDILTELVDGFFRLNISVNSPIRNHNNTTQRVSHNTDQFSLNSDNDINSTFLFPVEPGMPIPFRIELLLGSLESGSTSVFGMTELIFDGSELRGVTPLWDSNMIVVAELRYEINWMHNRDFIFPKYNLAKDVELFSDSSILSRITKKDLDITLSAFKSAQTLKEEVPMVPDNNFNSSSKFEGFKNSSTHFVHNSSTEFAMKKKVFTITHQSPKHKGNIHPECGDFASKSIVNKVLGHHSSLYDLIANTSPRENSIELWDIINSSIGKIVNKKLSVLADNSPNTVSSRITIKNNKMLFDRKNLRHLQMELVYQLRNYYFAYDVWGLLIVPALLDMPKIGNIWVASGKKYYPMYGFVSVGTHLFVDTSTVITSIDDALKHIPMIGIRTSKMDKSYSGSKFLDFEVTGECIIFLCWDMRCSSIPKWVSKKNFQVSQFKISTNESVHMVFTKRLYGASTQSLGGCSCSARDSNNYFILLGRLKSSGSTVSNLFKVPSCSVFGYKNKGTVIQPIVCDGVLPIWQLRPGFPLTSDSIEIESSDIEPISLTRDISTRSDSIENLTPTNSSSVNKSSDFYINTNIKLNISEIQFLFPENKSKISFLTLKFKNLTMYSNTLWQNKLGDYFSNFSRISAAAHGVISGTISSIDGSFAIDTNNHFLNPWPISLEVSKTTGSSLLSVDVSDDNKLEFILDSKSLPIIIDTIRNFKFVNRYDNILQSENETEEFIPQSEFLDILFLNKLGQDATIKLKFINRLKIKSEEHKLTSGGLIKLQIPAQYIDNIDPNIYAEMNIETADWSPVNQIKLSTTENLSNLYSMFPQYNSNTSEKDKSSGFHNYDTHFSTPPNGVVQEVDEDTLWLHETIGIEPTSILKHTQPIENELPDTSPIDLNLNFDPLKIKKSVNLSTKFSAPTIQPALNFFSNRRPSKQMEPIEFIQGSVSLNPNVLEENDSNKLDQGPFAMTLECRHRSKEEIYRELGLTRFPLRGRADTDDLNISSDLNLNYSNFNETYEDAEAEDRSERLTSIIESTIIASKEKKAVLISISSNVFLKNLSSAPVSILHGDRKISQPFESDESELYPLPLDVLSSGHVEFMRMWGDEDLTGNLISLSIRQEALDPFIPNALRRSTEYEKNSFYLRPFNIDPIINNAPCSLHDSTSSNDLTTLKYLSTESEKNVDSVLEKRSREIEKANFPVKWSLVALPSISFTNALPTSIELEIVQPPFPTEELQVEKLEMDGALELFFLPDEYDVKTSQADVEAPEKDWRPFRELESPNTSSSRISSSSLYRGVVRGGQKYDLPSFYQDRAIYFRVRIAGTFVWSKSFAVPIMIHQNRKKFVKHKAEPIKWDLKKSSIETSLNSNNQNLSDFSMKRSWRSDSNRTIEFFSSYWIINKTGLCLRYNSLALKSETKSDHFVNDSPNTSHLFSREEFSDSLNISNNKTHSVPIITNNFHNGIRFLPYDLTTNVLNDQYYIYNIKYHENLRNFRVSRSLRRDKPVYMSNDSLLAVSWPECILSLQSPTSLSCIIRTHENDSNLTCPEFITFQISHDSYVDLCIDSRSSHPPVWAERKFYKSLDTVSLGGNNHDSLPSLHDTMYFIIASKFSGSYIEPSIRNFKVKNQTGLFSSRILYQQLPWFTVGDRIYLDRDIKCFSIPARLKSSSILAIQTSDADADLDVDGLIQFDILQNSVVFLCIDSKISKLPSWIHLLKFKKRNLNILADIEGSLKFDLYSRSYKYPEFTRVSLNGIGLSSKEHNYFVLVVNENDLSTKKLSGDDLRVINSSPLNLIDLPPSVEGIVSPLLNLSTFWDESILGEISYQPVQLDPFGPQWSTVYDAEHDSKNEIEASNYLFSLSISRLPGIFSQTFVAMLLPKYIIISQLNFDLCIIPHIEIIEPDLNINVDDVFYGPRFIIGPHGSGVVYNFGGDLLVKKPQMNYKYKRLISVADASYKLDNDNFSKPLLFDDLSCPEQFIWLNYCMDNDSNSKALNEKILVQAKTMYEGSTTILVLSDISSKPPYRIENRSSSLTLSFRQSGTDESWVNLPPLSWKSYALYDSASPHYLELIVKNIDEQSKKISLDDIHAVTYMVLASKDSRQECYLSGLTTVDGTTRVLTINELSSKISLTRKFQDDKQNKPFISKTRNYQFYSSLLSIIDFKSKFHGLEISLINSDETDLISVYIEDIDLIYQGSNSHVNFSIKHIQIDDMRPLAKSKFAVVLSPTDSGLNSHIRGEEEVKWLSLKCDWNPFSKRILHIHNLELLVQKLDFKLDLDMIVNLFDFLGDSISFSNENQLSSIGSLIPSSKLQEIFMNAVKDILLFEMTDSIKKIQLQSDKIPIFIEKFYHSEVVISFEILLGISELTLKANSKINSLGGPVLSYVPGIIGSMANTSPTIGFQEKCIENYFGEVGNLINPIASSFQQQALVQIYKIFGSLDLIGDPLSLFEDIGSGFEKFLQKTEDEFSSLDLKGEGIKSLVFSIIGGVFNSLSKITGSIASIVNASTGNTRNYDMATERENFDSSVSSQAADILVRSVIHGFSSIIDEPGRGFSKEGSMGAIKGLFKGLVKLITTPVAGTFDAVSVVSGGVRSSLQLQARPVGRRRLPNSRN